MKRSCSQSKPGSEAKDNGNVLRCPERSQADEDRRTHQRRGDVDLLAEDDGAFPAEDVSNDPAEGRRGDTHRDCNRRARSARKRPARTRDRKQGQADCVEPQQVPVSMLGNVGKKNVAQDTTTQASR